MRDVLKYFVCLFILSMFWFVISHALCHWFYGIFYLKTSCCVQKLLKTNTSNTYLLLACYCRYVSIIVCFTVIVKFPSVSDNWKSMLEKVLHFRLIDAGSVIPWLKALYIIYIVGGKYQTWYFMAIIFLKIKVLKNLAKSRLMEMLLRIYFVQPLCCIVKESEALLRVKTAFPMSHR